MNNSRPKIQSRCLRVQFLQPIIIKIGIAGTKTTNGGMTRAATPPAAAFADALHSSRRGWQSRCAMPSLQKNISLDKLGVSLDACLQTTGVLAATMDRRHLKFSAQPEEIGSLIKALVKDGVIA